MDNSNIKIGDITKVLSYLLAIVFMYKVNYEVLRLIGLRGDIWLYLSAAFFVFGTTNALFHNWGSIGFEKIRVQVSSLVVILFVI